MILGGFECWECPQRFFTRDDRRAHCESAHPRPLPVDVALDLRAPHLGDAPAFL
jgi:hypothetical protein